MTRPLLCLLGWHRWIHLANIWQELRICDRCGKCQKRAVLSFCGEGRPWIDEPAAANAETEDKS